MSGVSLGLYALAILAAPTAGDWEEVDDDGGIKLWRRDVPGSDIVELKAEMTVEVSAQRIWDTIADIAAFVEWMPYVVESRVVATDRFGQYEYQLLDPPLVSKRDYTVRAVIDRPRWHRTWQQANHKGPPPRQDVVRITVTEGSWTLVPLGPSQCRVHYRLRTHPGGSIPNWIANQANESGVPDLLDGLRKRARDPAWKR